MYLPEQFEERNLEVLHQLMRDYPLATIVTAVDGLPNANHIPLQLIATPNSLGCLRGHIARANPLLQEAIDSPVEALVIFQGPNAYISPSWYSTKAVTGKVVPTWNYVAVHAYGILRIVDDPEWLGAQLEALTSVNEASFAEPWTVSDAPNDFIAKITEAIVGIEITITQLQGKWKVSQNQPQQNQQSVVNGLLEKGLLEMAALVEQKMSSN